MNESLIMVLAPLAGAVLGAVFFGGLWWTIRKGLSSNQPALWFFGSLVVRMSIVLTGLFFVGRGHWQRLLMCLMGFFIARLVVTWLTRPAAETLSRPLQEASHAS